MLTVEKDRLSLQLQKKEHFFTHLLWKAFGIAIFIHLLGFGLFQIKKLTSAESRWLFPPIQLEAPLLQEQTADVVTSQDESHLPIYLQNPRLSEPALPSLPPLSSLVANVSSLDLATNATYFPPLTSNPHLPSLPALTKNNQSVGQILVSGRLAERTQQQSPFLLNSSLDRDYHLQYIVLIDDQTGKVMWYESQDTDKVPGNILKEAEHFMQQLQFTSRSNSLTTEGTVEFHLQRGAL